MIKRNLIVILMLAAVSPVFAAEPAFVETKCPFSIPTGERATCGMLSVPENRDAKEGKNIKVFVTIVHSYSRQPKTDPIVYLEGNPDPAPSAQLAKGAYWSQLAPLRQDRDMIFVDQRGAGLSKPSLHCKNLSDPNLVSEQDYLIGLKNCRDKLVAEKIELSAFNTKESAQDVLALLRELGRKQFNILATSVGSRTALAIMSIEPQHVRSLVMNSAVPLLPSLTGDTQNAANNKRVFKQLFYDCGVDAICRKAFPNLEDVYLQLIRTLPTAATENKISAPFVVRVLSREVANHEALHYLPQAIFELAKLNRKGGLTLEQFNKVMNKNHINPVHAAVSYYCSDVGEMLKKEQTAASKDTPFYTVDNRQQCSIWGKGDALKILAKTTYTSVPTMVLTGEYDTVSPSQWSRDVAKELPNAKFFQFKGVGNDVVRSVRCALFMSASFFDRPDHKPEDGCVLALKAPVFYAQEKTPMPKQQAKATEKSEIKTQ